MQREHLESRAGLNRTSLAAIVAACALGLAACSNSGGGPVFDATIGIASVAASDSSYAAIDANGALWMWGYNSFGVLGVGDDSKRDKPTSVDTSEMSAPVAQVAVSSHHAVALDQRGVLWGWGDLVGDGAERSSSEVPVRVDMSSMVSPVSSIATGGNTSLALDESGQVWVWGSGEWSALGNARNDSVTTGVGENDRWSPSEIDDADIGLPIVAIAANGFMGLAADAAGGVWAWGHTDVNGFPADMKSPVALNTSGIDTAVTEVALGTGGALALDDTGRVWSLALHDGPRLVNTAEMTEPVVHLSAADSVTLALDADGRVWAWGDVVRCGTQDATSMIGANGTWESSTMNSQQEPQRIYMTDQEVRFQAIAGGLNGSYAADRDGVLWFWGTPANPTPTRWTP
jgi:alpha-tubulin suppressor-like RCC1 family protein